MNAKLPGADPRYFQICFQVTLLLYGILFLDWQANFLHYSISVAGCLFFSYTIECLRRKRLIDLKINGFSKWGLSTLISALSLCLLLKTSNWTISLLACFFTVISKYIFRFRSKHIFNPSAFGIILTIVITHKAWLSPGQWGNNAMIIFFILSLGFIIVSSVQKLDVSLAFLAVFSGLLFWRQVIVLHWPIDYFVHSISTGSLLIFSFFMISDPRTSPNHPLARILWAIGIASFSFYLTAFQWKYNTPVWVLVLAAPFVPLLDSVFKSKIFKWHNSAIQFNFISSLKKIVMLPIFKKTIFIVLITVIFTGESFAFCGFYVSKADGTLKNKTSQVIIVRDGDHNVITMYNDFIGNFKDFAMVVPVPVVLKKTDIKVIDPQVFQTLNDYSKPRLVEYFDENPCNRMQFYRALPGSLAGAAKDSGPALSEKENKKKFGVEIEAKYLVGEYDILILSAKESSGLKSWLEQNGYKIPSGANEVLEPYIKSNLKFFVVKVNEDEKKKFAGNFLRPIQISFTSPKFMLPIRLGMANADGDQDMLVYAFTKTGRIECTNYRTVALPTGKNIPLFVQNNFSGFYSNLFQHQWAREGQSIAMLEYAWDVSPHNYVKCDPCIATAPTTQDLVQSGVWWINRNWKDYSDVEKEVDYSNNVYFTRLHIRYNRRAFPQDLQFEVTPNTAPYQARYIITHPASGDLDCEGARQYLKTLRKRRQEEMEMLKDLTGKGYSDWDVVINTNEEKALPASIRYTSARLWNNHPQTNNIIIASIGFLVCISARRLARKKKI